MTVRAASRRLVGVLSSLGCAGAAYGVDILVFVRGSVRPLGPRGVKVGGGMWASCAGRVRKVDGEDSGSIGARRGGWEWV